MIYKRTCIMCSGSGQEEVPPPDADYTTPDRSQPCHWCSGTGEEIMSRAEMWARDREYIGLKHPRADSNGYEKWPRFVAMIPPELAEELDRVHKKRLGVNVSSFSRAGLVRSALREYLDRHSPERPPAIDVTSEEVIDPPQRPALEEAHGA